ncbi:ABC transporter substrate-binding protein [Thermodesulfobacteriota bacterium]
MKRGTIVLTVLLAICFAFTATPPAFGADVIKIGVIGPMNFVQGKAQWKGAVLAAEQVNAKGGVNVGGKKMKIELVQADSNEFLNVTDATNAMEMICTRDKVDLIVGGFRSEAVLAMQDIAMDYKKIFIGCGAAHNELCVRVAKDYDRYKYWFRGTPQNSSYLFAACLHQLGVVVRALKVQLKIPKIKVAIVAEKAMWVEGLVGGAQKFFPEKLGVEIVGVWRPSQTATDVSAELAAVEKSGAHIIYTIFSATVGITFARQAGELKVPAVQVGINVEAQKQGFMDATQGMGNYVMTSNTYCEGVESNELTAPFYNAYVKRWGEPPVYNSDTYSAIVNTLIPSIEAVGSLDADKIVANLENRVYKSCSGTVKYMKTKEGKHLHDLTWGPGYVTGLATQWQDGKMKGVWPFKWVAAKGAPEVTYSGMVPYKIAPWVVEKYKK